MRLFEEFSIENDEWSYNLESNQNIPKEWLTLLEYPIEGKKPIVQIHQVGLEPTTYGLEGRCSSDWAIGA